MDLSSVLPDFQLKPHAHIIPPLERNRITTVDLITLDVLEIARRAHVPPADVRRLITQVTRALHHDVGFEDQPDPDASEPSSSIIQDVPLALGPATRLDLSQWSVISTLDPALDALLGGGIPTGYLTEVTGESGSGKTQFLLTLLLAAQLPAPRGLNGRTAIYISTEAPLSTPRLSQLLEFHPYLSTLPPDDAPSLEKILSINAMDLESQDHIFNYQLPVAVTRYNVGLVVVDSITSNYRAEHSIHSLQGLTARTGELTKLGQLLRNLAVKTDIAIVVANQVSDRFEGIEGDDSGTGAPHRVTSTPGSSTPSSQPYQPPPSQLAPPTREVAPSPLSRPPQTQPPPGGEDPNALSLTQPNILPPSSPPILSYSPSPYPVEGGEDPQQQEQQQQQEQSQQFDGSYLVGNPVRNELLSLIHQQRFFTGWGDDNPSFYPGGFAGFQRQQAQKTPALGLVWSTQVACRIALKKEVRSLTVDPLLGAYGESSEVLVERPHKEITVDRDRDEDEEDAPDPDVPNLFSSPVQDEEKGNHISEPDKANDPETKPGPAPEPGPELQLHSQQQAEAQAQIQAQPQSQPQSQVPPIIQGPLRRTMKLVFAPWAANSTEEVEFTIWKGGLTSERGTT